jgi:hypothetical protein
MGVWACKLNLKSLPVDFVVAWIIQARDLWDASANLGGAASIWCAPRNFRQGKEGSPTPTLNVIQLHPHPHFPHDWNWCTSIWAPHPDGLALTWWQITWFFPRRVTTAILVALGRFTKYRRSHGFCDTLLPLQSNINPSLTQPVNNATNNAAINAVVRHPQQPSSFLTTSSIPIPVLNHVFSHVFIRRRNVVLVKLWSFGILPISMRHDTTRSRSMSTEVVGASASDANKATAKRVFKTLARRYMRTHNPPSKQDLEPLAGHKNQFTWHDIISWRDEVGLNRGVVYEDDGNVVYRMAQPPHMTG